MGTIRFLLAIAVVVTHMGSTKVVGYTLVPGSLAVQCFYVISGFLITMILTEKPAYKNLVTFYVSRYLRLWPAYVVVALLSLVFVKWQTLTTLMPSHAGLPTQIFIILSNITIFFQDWFMFFQFDGSGGLAFTKDFRTGTEPMLWWMLLVPQAWSLGVEITFYIIAPFLMRGWKGAAAIFLFGLVVQVLVLKYLPHEDPWTYRFSPSAMMLFAAGGLAYFASSVVLPRFPNATRYAAGSLVVAMVGLILVAWPLIGKTVDVPTHSLLANKAILLGLVTLGVMVVSVGPLFYGLKNRFDFFVGELSYPIYICHYFLIDTIGAHFKDNIVLANFFVYGIVVAGSIVLYFGVVKPTEHYRKRLSGRRQKVAPPTPVSVVIT
jgi:peptidoglycan/LPS O-acetylase OafA/YrhL